MVWKLVGRCLRQRGGATAIEFAIVAPVFFYIMLGIIEFGLYMFHRTAIEGITMQAAREATLGKTSGDTVCSNSTTTVDYIKCVVQEKSQGLIRGEATMIQVQPLSAGGTSVPDICLDNPSYPSSEPADCKHYEEVNGINNYQGMAASNAGAAGDLVEVRVVYPWQILLPGLGVIWGKNGVSLVTASTVVKNEPYE